MPVAKPVAADQSMNRAARNTSPCRPCATTLSRMHRQKCMCAFRALAAQLGNALANSRHIIQDKAPRVGLKMAKSMLAGSTIRRWCSGLFGSGLKGPLEERRASNSGSG